MLLFALLTLLFQAAKKSPTASYDRRGVSLCFKSRGGLLFSRLSKTQRAQRPKDKDVGG